MKYLLSFNESYKEDKVLAIKSVRKKYEDTISNHLLYLSDNYNTIKSQWDADEFFSMEFKVDENETKEKLLDLLKASIDKLEYNKYIYLDDYRINIGTTFDIDREKYNYVGIIYLKDLEKIVNQVSPINTIKFIITNPK